MSARKTVDAIELLKDDHKVVQDMFREFEKLHEAKEEGSDDMKQELIDSVCAALTVHMQIEEEIFYPAAREALDDGEDLLNEAEVEHDGVKDLIEELEEGSASDPMTCARFLVLAEQVDHHVKEEHEEMFPKLRKAKFDAAALGVEMAERKAELEGEEPAEVPQGARGQPGSGPRARR
jgi:hemerythrin-like domain-containing protein